MEGTPHKRRISVILSCICLMALLCSVLTIPAAGAPASASSIPSSPGWETRPVRLPPVLWYESNPRLDRRFLMVSMLYWDYKEKDSAHRLLLPVFYRWREEDRSLLVSLPFVVSYRRPEEKWMVAGLFYRHAEKEKTQTALFPLYWQRVRREGGRTTVALPFLFYDYRSHDRNRLDQASLLGWRRRRGETVSGALLNYWWSKDSDSGFRTFFPIYWHRESLGQRFDVLGPLYYRREVSTSLVSRSIRANSPPSPQQRTRSNLGLFPLIGAGWQNGRFSSSYVFPLYYHSRSLDGRTWVTLPASSWRSSDSHKGHLGFYFFSHDPDLRVDGFFPLWFNRQSSDGFESSRQFLNFYYRRENDESFHTVFPLYGRWSSPEARTFLSWGAFSRRTPDSSTGWAYLYYWKRAPSASPAVKKGVTANDTTRIFFPLYWHYSRQPDWGLDLIFPVYARYTDGETSWTAVPPFVWRRSGNRLTWSFLALYWRDQSDDRGFTTALPFFLSQYDPKRKVFLSPFAWTRKSSLSREGIIPPVYWYKSAESRRLLIVPLYWKFEKEQAGLTIVFPYYSWRNEDRFSYGFFPIWGRHRTAKTRGGYLFPLYWHSHDLSGNGHLVVPLALTYIGRQGVGTENERLSVQYLVLGNVQKQGKTYFSHEFFPLYKYVRQPDYANFWAPRIIALTAWERKGDVRKGYVFPYLWRRGPEKDWDLFIPLWYQSRLYDVRGDTETKRIRGERTSGATVFFPLYWSGFNSERRYRTFIPLYTHYSEPQRRFDTVLPLWVGYNAASGNKFRLLFPLYWRFFFKGGPVVVSKNAETTAPKTRPDREIVVLGPWYRVNTWRDGQRSRTVGLAPLFSVGSDERDNAFWEVLGGLVGRDRKEGVSRYRFLYFFYTKPRNIVQEQYKT